MGRSATQSNLCAYQGPYIRPRSQKSGATFRPRLLIPYGWRDHQSVLRHLPSPDTRQMEQQLQSDISSLPACNPHLYLMPQSRHLSILSKSLRCWYPELLLHCYTAVSVSRLCGRSSHPVTRGAHTCRPSCRLCFSLAPPRLIRALMRRHLR